MTRVQMILDEREKERFRRQADLEGLSLSAWLRRAAQERLAAKSEPPLTTPAELRAFFRACDARERGREPDWEEHRRVIERSIGAGHGER